MLLKWADGHVWAEVAQLFYLSALSGTVGERLSIVGCCYTLRAHTSSHTHTLLFPLRLATARTKWCTVCSSTTSLYRTLCITYVVQLGKREGEREKTHEHSQTWLLHWQERERGRKVRVPLRARANRPRRWMLGAQYRDSGEGRTKKRWL